MNIFEALRESHERQRDLSEKLIKTSGMSEERKQLFYDLIFKAVPTCATASILVSMVLYFIL